METKNSMSGHFEDKENDELMKAWKRIPKKRGVYSEDGGVTAFQ